MTAFGWATGDNLTVVYERFRPQRDELIAMRDFAGVGMALSRLLPGRGPFEIVRLRRHEEEAWPS